MAAVPFILFILFVLGIWLGVYHLGPALVVAVGATGRRLLRLATRHPRVAAFESAWESRIGVIRSYAPVFLIAALGAAASIAAGDVFMELAEAMRQNSPGLARADAFVWESASLYHSSAGTPFFTFFTLLGTPVALAGVVLAVSIALAMQGRDRWLAYLILTSVGGGLINLALKEIFERQRPDLAAALRYASGHSFPSGHAMGATVVFGALAYLAVRALPTWRGKSGFIALAIATVLAICSSRIYLGVHWISDIAAGVTAGLVWVVATTLAYETVRRVRAVRAQDSRMRGT